MATETVEYTISGINNQITDEFGADNDLTVKGGGRGWTATTTIKGAVWSAKATSKLGAAEALYDAIKADASFTEPGVTPDEVMDEPKAARAPRLTMEEVLAAFVAVFPTTTIADAGEDEEAGPTWASGKLTAIVPCNAECMSGTSDLCECRCQGANHGLAGLSFLTRYTEANTALQRQQAIADARPTVLGQKLCKCGCGETTNRTFRPGHDARYHGERLRAKQAADRGVSVADLPRILRRERRAARKAQAE